MELPTTVLIAGGTGRQGGAVVNALLQDSTSRLKPNQIYVITRNSASLPAQRLAARGINLVKGTLGDPTPVFRQLENDGVKLTRTATFLAQAHGPTELDDAKQFIDAAARSGVQHFVYSSVDRGGRHLSDADPSYCKTFSDKFHIEKYLIGATSKAGSGDASMDYTILRPVWFADNALWGFPGQLCMTGWRENLGGKRMQVVVSKDLGRWAAEAILRPDRSGLRNEAVSIASETISFQEVDGIFRKVTGKPVPVTYGWLARFVIWAVKDLNTMFGFINEREYGADLPWLSQYVKPTTFGEWLQENVQNKRE